MFFAPESPWWLVRKGRLEQAAKSVERLGRKTKTMTSETVAMMRRVIDMEAAEKEPTYVELFKGTDLRRTLIVAGVYAAQNLTGNCKQSPGQIVPQRQRSSCAQTLDPVLPWIELSADS